MLKDELDYFIEHQTELVQKYRGKILALKDHAAGTFALQRCEPGTDAYTVTISSTLFMDAQHGAA